MIPLGDLLSLLNRKERYYVITKVFGESVNRLSCEFLKDVQTVLNTYNEGGISIPKDHKWFFDYHIDWIEAAIFLYLQYPCETSVEKLLSFNPKVKWQQIESKLCFSPLDVDFLIYFKGDNSDNFIFIEAKYEGKWDIKQVDEKFGRLNFISEKCEKLSVNLKQKPKINFYYMLMSPTNPRFLVQCKNKMKKEEIPWIELGKDKNLYSVSRCDENGYKSIQGDCWSLFSSE